MTDIADILGVWLDEDLPFALATVVKTWGSSPRQVGSCMAVSVDGQVLGSVSGGCVEGVVIEAAQNALTCSEPKYLYFEAISNDAAWSVGLSCGGEIEVWIEPHPSDIVKSLSLIASDQAFVRLIDRSGNRTLAASSIEEVPQELRMVTEQAFLAESCIKTDDCFAHYFGPSPVLLIIGAGHISIPLVQMAKTLGFRTVVIDPRASFARADRFAVQPDELICAWPDESLAEFRLHSGCYAVCLSHDPKIDEPALMGLLPSSVKYVGALGSRATQATRRANLQEAGLSPFDIDRLRGPVGLDIGAKTPEEIAVSILAEIIQVRHGKS